MQRELAASGLSPEEILAKTLLLQKAMAGDNSPAFINKTLKNALNVANMNKDDLTKVNNKRKEVCNNLSKGNTMIKLMYAIISQRVINNQTKVSNEFLCCNTRAAVTWLTTNVIATQPLTHVCSH